VQRQLAACATNLVSIAGPVVERLTAEHPYFRADTIPSRLSGAAADVPTLGVSVTLVTTASRDERVVRTVAMGILRNLDELKILHPTLSLLDPERMARESLVVPLHPGATAAFREFGLLR
jgi:TRAP transporter TAXI family solute receptor